jgi:mRNA interferase MazF
MVRTPEQGDILLLNTAPRSGHEQTGKRPYIVLSHNIVAKNSNVVIVAPITTTKRVYPLYVAIPKELGMKTKGKVMLDQLTTIDYEARECLFLEKADDLLVIDLLKKIRAVFQKNS